MAIVTRQNFEGGRLEETRWTNKASLHTRTRVMDDDLRPQLRTTVAVVVMMNIVMM